MEDSVHNYGNISRCGFNQYHPPDNTLVGLSPAVCETTLVVGYSCFSGVRVVISYDDDNCWCVCF